MVETVAFTKMTHKKIVVQYNKCKHTTLPLHENKCNFLMACIKSINFSIEFLLHKVRVFIRSVVLVSLFSNVKT